MNGAVTSIEAVHASPAAAQPTPLANPNPPAVGEFGQWMTREVQTLNRQLVVAEQGVQALAAGSAQDLHQVMIQLEQARLALQLAAQVRSRVVEAYQDVMRMQV